LLLLVFIATQAKCQVPPTYEVYAVAFTNSIREAGKWSAVRNAPDTLEMCFMAWLVKGNNGKVILIDAGLCIKGVRYVSTMNYQHVGIRTTEL